MGSLAQCCDGDGPSHTDALAPRQTDRHLDRQDMGWLSTLVTHADLSAWAGAWGAPQDAPRRAFGPRDVLGSMGSSPTEKETYHGRHQPCPVLRLGESA
eukprot:9501806-Pyramimonas_sp.AAC.1